MLSGNGNSGAPPAGAGGSFPKRDIPRLPESIQSPAGAGAFCSGVNNLYTVSFGEIGLFDLIKNEYAA